MIYPNPSNGVVNISSDQEMSRYQLYDLQGDLLIDNILSDKNATIDIKDFGSGLYILKIQYSDKLSQYYKIIKN